MQGREDVDAVYEMGLESLNERLLPLLSIGEFEISYDWQIEGLYEVTFLS